MKAGDKIHYVDRAPQDTHPYGYKVRGPATDGELEVEDEESDEYSGHSMFFTKPDVEMMLKRFEETQ